jgi:hypothetical protein
VYTVSGELSLDDIITDDLKRAELSFRLSPIEIEFTSLSKQESSNPIATIIEATAIKLMSKKHPATIEDATPNLLHFMFASIHPLI